MNPLIRAVAVLHIILAATFWLCTIGAFALAVNDYSNGRMIVAIVLSLIATIMTPTTHDN